MAHIKIVEILLRILSKAYTDYIVAKWVAEIRVWWENQNNRRMKTLVDLHYHKLKKNQDLYKKDRDQV